MGVPKVLMNSTVCVVILSIVLGVIYLTFSNAEAISREEAKIIQIQLDDIEIKIENIEVDLTSARNLITETEIELVVAVEDLRKAKRDANTSWTAVENILLAEKNILNAKDGIKNAEEQLNSLLDTKNQFVKKQNKYNAQLRFQDSAQPIPVQNTTSVQNPTNATLIQYPTNSTFIDNSTSTLNPFNLLSRNDTKVLSRGIGMDLGLFNKIGIQLSGTCITMIKNNITTNCPTYKDLILYDSSNTEVSGKFGTDENGFFSRKVPALQESWRWYDYDGSARIFVDPPLGMQSRIMMISLVPNFVDYFVRSDMTQEYGLQTVNQTKIVNGTETLVEKVISFFNPEPYQDTALVLYHDRYIQDCKNATINVNRDSFNGTAGWKELLDDTIMYMQNDCDESITIIDVREVIPLNKTEIDVLTSPNWVYLRSQEAIKTSCIITRTCEIDIEPIVKVEEILPTITVNSTENIETEPICYARGIVQRCS